MGGDDTDSTPAAKGGKKAVGFGSVVTYAQLGITAKDYNKPITLYAGKKVLIFPC